MVELDPFEDVKYRLELARDHLEGARKALEVREFAIAVGEAQLSIENAAKAVISCFRIPTWSHDPSEELREIVKEKEGRIVETLGPDFLAKLEELASLAHEVAPEHGRVAYGDLTKRTPPRRLYSEAEAEKAVRGAEKALAVATTFVNKWKVFLRE
jgi:HEPN domain-containing protein